MVGLHSHFEPCLAIREAGVLADMTNMVKKEAKTPAETKQLVLDLEDKIRKVTEVTGTPPSDQHTKSILAGLMDKETSMHCGVHISSGMTYEELKHRILQFVNAMMARSSDKIYLSKISSEPSDSSDSGPWSEGTREEDWGEGAAAEKGDYYGLNAMGKAKGKGGICYQCLKPGHQWRNCPEEGNKGKGKGKPGEWNYESKGGGNGKGNWGAQGKGGNWGNQWNTPNKGGGKGSVKGCFDCGGAHYRGDPSCPEGKRGQIRLLCCLTGKENNSNGKNINNDKDKRIHTVKDKTMLTLKDKTIAGFSIAASRMDYDDAFAEVPSRRKRLQKVPGLEILGSNVREQPAANGGRFACLGVSYQSEDESEEDEPEAEDRELADSILKAVIQQRGERRLCQATVHKTAKPPYAHTTDLGSKCTGLDSKFKIKVPEAVCCPPGDEDTKCTHEGPRLDVRASVRNGDWVARCSMQTLWSIRTEYFRHRRASRYQRHRDAGRVGANQDGCRQWCQ